MSLDFARYDGEGEVSGVGDYVIIGGNDHPSKGISEDLTCNARRDDLVRAKLFAPVRASKTDLSAFA